MYFVKVSECCDPEIRGVLGSLPTLSMSLGIVLSYVAGKWLYWRHLAFFSATFCGKIVFFGIEACFFSSEILGYHAANRNIISD